MAGIDTDIVLELSEFDISFDKMESKYDEYTRTNTASFKLTRVHPGPLTTSDWFLPRGNTERLLRETGVAYISLLPAHRVEHRQFEVVTAEGFSALVCVYLIYMPRKKCLLNIQPG